MKPISLLFLMLFVFQSTPTFSMNENEEKTSLSKTKLSAGQQNQKDAVRSNDDSCTHYGLKRWSYGIKEYVIDRLLCCASECVFDPVDSDRAYINKRSQDTIVTTDCWGILLTDKYSIWEGDCVNNWLSGICCLPILTMTHMMCLPVACCYPTKEDWWGSESECKRVESECKRVEHEIWLHKKHKREKEEKKEKKPELERVPTTELARLANLTLKEEVNMRKKHGTGNISDRECSGIIKKIDNELSWELSYLNKKTYKNIY